MTITRNRFGWVVALTLLPMLLMVMSAQSVPTAAGQASTPVPSATLFGGKWNLLFIAMTNTIGGDGKYHPNLFVIDLETKRTHRFTDNRSGAVYDFPSFSPDGKHVVFGIWNDWPKVNGNYGHFNIYVMDIGTANVRRLTEGQSDSRPSWSPDGKRIAFLSMRGQNSGIYVMDADGKNQRMLSSVVPAGFYWSVSWSHDGQNIALVLDQDASCPHIFLISADGTHPRQLTDYPECDGTSLSWSPDSKHIAFSKQDGHIYIMDVDGSNVKQLTHGVGAFRSSPSWSPDGKRIAFFTFPDVNVAVGKSNIEIMDANGSNIRTLTNNHSDINYRSLSWQP